MAHDPDDFGATFTAMWPTLQPGARDADASGTIRPSWSDSEGSQRAAIEELLPTPSPPSAVGDTGDTLGEGGMGIVRLAEQSSLQREVAAKTLRSEVLAPSAARRLLQEAWVTGLLEHPNIVPVYDIARNEVGAPVILMKRIEGRTWESMAADADAIAQTGTSDPLEWHCRTFLAVCNAVRYAHDRGIMHRDIKPENVMIGAHGEVYLLDWGIAAALDDRYGNRLPLARNENRLAGTPRFMAPEMALGRGSVFGAHTDVYLLGATLFTVLTGSAPHQGVQLQDILAGIGSFVPLLPDHPPALERIVQRAMAGDPASRFADVGELGRAMLAFLERRGSIAHAEEGSAALSDWRALPAGAPERSELQSRAAFAFRQALREWPDNGAAQAGLTEVQAAIDAEAAELAHRRREADPLVGASTRIGVLSVVGAAWFVVPLVTYFYDPVVTWIGLQMTTVLLLVLGTALGLYARENLAKTQLNRVSYWGVMLVPTLQILSDGTVYTLGGDALDAFLARQLCWTAIGAMYVISTVPEAWMMVPGLAIAAAWTSLVPEQAVLSAAFGNGSVVLAGFAVWKHQKDLSKD